MWKGIIKADPAVMLGKPTIAGTRITVELVLDKLAAGETVAQILAAHPRLTEIGIRAALAFAAEALRSEWCIRPTRPRLTFLADENVDQEIIDRLRSDGHAVLVVAEMEPGIDDEAVLSLAREQGGIL